MTLSISQHDCVQALTAATLRSAEKLWLPVLQAQLQQSSFSQRDAGDVEEEERPRPVPVRQDDSLSLKQASLLWADSTAASGRARSSWTWSDLDLDFGTGSAEGISVVVPLVDMAQDFVQLEVIAGSHRAEGVELAGGLDGSNIAGLKA